MSAIKKQTSLRWSHNNELSPGGNIVATVWTASLGRLSLEVTNYPGTKSLDWRITIPGTDWYNGGMVDRFEYTVSTLKDFVFNKAVAINEAQRQNTV